MVIVIIILIVLAVLCFARYYKLNKTTDSCDTSRGDARTATKKYENQRYVKYPAGMYKAGVDISIGEYVVRSKRNQYCTITIKGEKQREKRVNLTFLGNCIVGFKYGDVVEIIDGSFSSSKSVHSISQNALNYMLKVGTHISPGTYVISQADRSEFAIYYILEDSTLNLNSAKDSDAIWGEKEVELRLNDYVFFENALLRKKV